MSSNFECPECLYVHTSAAAALYCDCGDEQPTRVTYRPRRWDDYDD